MKNKNFRWSLVNWPATATFTSLRWVGLHCDNCNYCTHRWNLCLHRDQTNVGGRGKQIRWQVDCSAEERWHSPSRSRQAFSLTGLSSRCWENLVLAMLGEQFMVGEEICGAVVSIRFQEDILRWGSVKGYSFCKFFAQLFFAASGTGLHAIRPWPTGSEIHSDGFSYFMLFHISGLTVFVCSLPISPRCSVFQLARRSSTRLITTASSEFDFAQIWEFCLQISRGVKFMGDVWVVNSENLRSIENSPHGPICREHTGARTKPV